MLQQLLQTVKEQQGTEDADGAIDPQAPENCGDLLTGSVNLLISAKRKLAGNSVGQV